MVFIPNREVVVLPICKGKSVLDIGCACPEYLHDKICKVAEKCIGVDIRYDMVKKLRNRGFTTCFTLCLEK